MSSPRSSVPRTPEQQMNGYSGNRTPNRNTPRNARTQSSRLSTPARSRIVGTSERDVIPPSDGEITTPRNSQPAPFSSPFHAGSTV